MNLCIDTENKDLPDEFDEKKVQFHEKDNCEICILKFNTSNRRHHCRRCGKSVCNKCSANQKALSKSDSKTLYRICDACDTEIQNYKVRLVEYYSNLSLVKRKPRWYNNMLRGSNKYFQ
jgi:hypothetical protein